MKTKQYLGDIVIILLYPYWVLNYCEVLSLPYISLFIMLLYLLLFEESCRRTAKPDRETRYAALMYGMLFMIAWLCGVKITEMLRDHVLEMDAWFLVSSTVFAQSVFFLIKRSLARGKEK